MRCSQSAFALLLAVSVGTGSAALSPHEILRILLLREGAGTAAYNVLLKIRLPRVLAAAVMGGTLSVSGFLLQTFFRNPIAGPYVLGVSSGCKVAVGAVMIFGMKLWGCVPFGCGDDRGICRGNALRELCDDRLPKDSQHGDAAGRRHDDWQRLFGGDGFLRHLRQRKRYCEPHQLVDGQLFCRVVGKFAHLLGGDCRLPAAVPAAGEAIGAYQFGEHYAASMGVNVRRFRAALIGLSCLLAACVTALVGPISFVGIAVPYMTKKLLGTAKPMAVLPGCFLLGGVFCDWQADWIARTAFSPTELAISTVTAFFGAPVIIVMALKRGGGHR